MSAKSESFSILGCFKRTFRPGHLVAPPAVEKIFHAYAESEILSPAKLKQFLNEVQGQPDATEEDAQKIIDQQLAHERHGHSKVNKHGLTLDAFLHYLLDPVGNIAYNDKLHQDMTLPASHYYIYTGHNSYLTGNQLNSDCSEVPIIAALRRGVRVIELDLWPNKKNENEISVLHGGTMTSPVAFEKCMVAIRDNAFVASPYPVVITFEDHLSPELQSKAAEITTRVLGNLLKIPDENEKFTEFPSPESIKGRILISTKPPSEYLKGKKGSDSKVEKVENAASKVAPTKEKLVVKANVKEEFDWGDEVPSFDATGNSANSECPVEVDDPVEEEDVDKDGQIDHVANPEYKKIIAIRAGKPKGGSLVSALLVDQFVKRVSLSEPQLEKVAQKNPSALIEFTERNLLRIYPYGLRFNSSNYNPLIGWSHGAQMVAFNMQGYGRPLWLVHGFFRANGNSGYVKKPDFLLRSDSTQKFDPKKELQPKMTLRVKVIMGLGWLERFGKHYFDNFSPPDFYTRDGRVLDSVCTSKIHSLRFANGGPSKPSLWPIQHLSMLNFHPLPWLQVANQLTLYGCLKVGIAGVPADTVMKETKPIEDQWIPQWEKEFDFPLTVPELALLRVEVHEYDMTDKDDFGGQTCLPVSEIKRGLRSIPLMDKKGLPLDGVRLLFQLDIIPTS